MFSMSFTTDNAAFEDGPELETARVLREVATQLESGQTFGLCRDSNGNQIGNWALTAE